MNNDGWNTPPLPPEPIVTDVASSFRKKSNAIDWAALPPDKASSIACSPRPSTPESTSPSVPTISPPTTGIHNWGGKRRAVKRSSVQYSTWMKATPPHATSPPRIAYSGISVACSRR